MRKKSLLGMKLARGLEEEMTSWACISPLAELGRGSKVMVGGKVRCGRRGHREPWGRIRWRSLLFSCEPREVSALRI